MRTEFLDKLNQKKRIEEYQKEIKKLLEKRPNLIPFQKTIEEKLDKIGSIKTPEGRVNRAVLAYVMMSDALKDLRIGFEDYQKGVADVIMGKRKPNLKLVK